MTDALRLPVQTLPQPDETTCGPTCLHAVYRYWGDQEPLDTIIARMYRLAAWIATRAQSGSNGTASVASITGREREPASGLGGVAG